MNTVIKAWSLVIAITFVVACFLFLIQPHNSFARNIMEYRDLISDSTPLKESNHTLSFVLDTTIAPSSYIEITPPPGFEIIATTTFSEDRNVELAVDSVLRNSGSVLSVSVDQVEIIPGSPGLIRYTLNPTVGIAEGSRLELRIGNHTSKSVLQFTESFSTTTGTTTAYADIKPIINSSEVGTHKVNLLVYDGVQVANADFNIAVIDTVGVGPVDTTEDIPPFRFNGSPTSTITGTTLNVEMFLETNELAICKYSLLPDVEYNFMPITFSNTGLIYHTTVVAVVPNSLQRFYIRCMDDEGNFNTDDYLIEFSVTDRPTGTANEDGDVEGDGTGSGNDGTGSGAGGGGTEGQADGEAPELGGTSGTGGSGGGGGGGSGGARGNTAGGGFESTDAPFRSGDGRVTVNGFTSPRTDIFVLVDGKEAKRVTSGNSGEYSVLIDGIARGAYTFGIYARDPEGTRSSTFSTSFTVTGARTSALSNINIAPTIKVSPDPVNPGEPLTISGYTIPNASVTLENEKDGSAASRQAFTTSANSSGAWSQSITTNNFSVGTYKARAKAEQAGIATTNFSTYTLYGVGQSANRPITTDLNRDGKVNLVDFSILLFWWGTDGGTSDPSVDVNSDTRVNLVDFSILLFNWTG